MDFGEIAVFGVGALFGVAGLFVIVYLVWRKWVRSEASDLLKQVFPVWAAQGPFENGEKSAEAMRLAWVAVMGPEQAKDSADAIRQHRDAFDADPDKWEEMRQTAFDSASPQTHQFAGGIKAAEALNKDILEGGGHRLEFMKMPDGSTQLVRNQIWSDAAVEEKRRADDEAIASGIGDGMLSANSPEAQALVSLLREVYVANEGGEPIPSDLGRTWLGLFSFSEENPGSELAREFNELNNAYSATLPDMDSDGLEWSKDPGCFEAHLKRKKGNPLYPEPDRVVTQADIDVAKQRDQNDAAALERQSKELATDLTQLPKLATTDQFYPFRQRIDELLDQAAAIGGPANKAAKTLQRLRASYIATWRNAIQDDKKALEALDKAEKTQKEHVRIMRSQFVAQLSRIDEKDVISSMLCESPETIRLTIDLFSGENREVVVNTALALLDQAKASGADIPQLEEKIKAIRHKE